MNTRRKAKLTRGQRAADVVTDFVGSWPFIILQSIALGVWVLINSLSFFHAVQWDRRPFILLNLMLSFQAAYTGPVVMISQRRQCARDRELLEETHRAAMKELTILREIHGSHNVR